MTDSHKFQQALDEINAKAAAKLSTKVWNATKKGASKLAAGSKEALKRAGVTAQNAIVAGAAAPLGVKVADSYNRPHKRKEHKYSASDVAAISTATRKYESYSDRLRAAASILEEQTKKKSSDLKNAAKTVAGSTAAGAGVGGTLGAGMAGGLANKAARTVGLTQRRGLGKAVRRGLTGLAGVAGGTYGVASGALKGLVGGAALAGTGYAIKKMKDAKKAKAQSKHESLRESIDRLNAFLEFARKKSDNKSHFKKLPESPVSKGKKKIIADAERVAGVTPEVDSATQAKRKAAAAKGQITKAANKAAKQQALEATYNKPLIDAAQGTKKTASKTVANAAKTITKTAKTAKTVGDRAAKAKEVFNGSTAFKKALNKAAFKGGLKGAALTAGLGAAAYGVHKYRNRDNY